ncbi:MAG: hypothetical protein Q7U98_07405, partial [Methylicorpusculum sp.]|uniref:hypothetical protein n=1 Tax=Methylicorpusculum sp. TaxID=2713644 RepID=UPI002726F3D3
VWDVSIEDRREPLHGGLTAAIPAADILASHTPYLHKVNHFLSIKGVINGIGMLMIPARTDSDF